MGNFPTKNYKNMFSGSYLYNIDEKSRVSLPMRLRKQISSEAENSFHLLNEIEKCIALYPNNEWRKKEEKMLKLSEYDQTASFVRRELTARAFEVEMDKQYRLLIPQNLLEEVHLTKSSPVLILGQMNKIELWNPEEYEKYKKQFPDSFGDYLRRFENVL